MLWCECGRRGGKGLGEQLAHSSSRLAIAPVSILSMKFGRETEWNFIRQTSFVKSWRSAFLQLPVMNCRPAIITSLLIIGVKKRLLLPQMGKYVLACPGEIEVV